jgi:hypothetical protein
MKIQAELSLYPLRTRELAPSIESFLRGLARKDISIDPGPMRAGQSFGPSPKALMRSQKEMRLY